MIIEGKEDKGEWLEEDKGEELLEIYSFFRIDDLKAKKRSFDTDSRTFYTRNEELLFVDINFLTVSHQIGRFLQNNP